MSSDEEFSFVLEKTSPSEETLEGIQALIKRHMEQYQQLLNDGKDLEASIAEAQSLKEEFEERIKTLKQDIDDDGQRSTEQLTQDQERLLFLQKEEVELKKELEMAMSELQEEEASNQRLRQQADVFSAAPEKVVVFKGATGRIQDEPMFDMEPQIFYPMEGGTALVTFEEEAVAKKILTKKEHRVELGDGDFHIFVGTRPVPVTLLKLVEIDAEVCPHRILISDLPQMDSETLKDKLFIHFSRSRIGGGEVESCEKLPDSGNIVLTFVGDNIAKGLTDTEYHSVTLPDGTHRVRVTPFVNGKITNLETRTKLCSRSVMLTGIPDVADAETLQDLLEIHFQKSTNGGGEIESFLYNPLGHSKMAVLGTPQPGENNNE